MTESNSTRRPNIPAEIKRRVLIESGHRCAIPKCRHIEVDIHHITPWAQCQTHDYGNLIALCPNCHRMAHDGKIDRQSLRIYKSRLRLAHDRFSNFEVDVLMELAKGGPHEGMPWPSFNMMLLKRLFDAGYVQGNDLGQHMRIGQFSMNLLLIGVTQSGREFVDSLSLDED